MSARRRPRPADELAAEIDRELAPAAERPAPPAAGHTTHTTHTTQWPDPLGEEAYYGLAGEIVRAIEPTTEGHPAALLLQLLIAYGSAVGRHAHYLVEATLHHPNEFICLVGRTAKARKGTALDRVMAVMREVAPEWAHDCVASGLSSGEGLIYQVRDQVLDTDRNGETRVSDPGIRDKRLLVVETELATMLRRLEREANSLSPILRDAWDGREVLRSMTKTARTQATAAHISIVGHCTSEELARYLSRTEMANGLGNRFLLVATERARLLPRGSHAPDLGDLSRRLKSAMSWAAQAWRRVDFSPMAGRMWDGVYGRLSTVEPGLMGSMIARAEAHAVRLAMLYALLDCSQTIEPPHLLAALALIEYAEASAHHVFGAALGDDRADETLSWLQAAGEAGMTTEDVYRAASNRSRSRELAALVARGLARTEREETAGRPAVRYHYVAPRAKPTAAYVSLARECVVSVVSVVSASPEPASRPVAYLTPYPDGYHLVGEDGTAALNGRGEDPGAFATVAAARACGERYGYQVEEARPR